jgi:hypothetical protein
VKVILVFFGILAATVVAVIIGWFYLVSSFRGGGDVVTEDRVLPPFSRIVIEGFADVRLVQGAAESVRVAAPQKQLATVRTQVSDGTLTISAGASRSWWLAFFGGGGRGTQLRITFRDLESIDAAGAVKLRAEGIKADRLRVQASGATSLRIDALDANELSVSGSGAMKVELAGRVAQQRVSISGAGDYRAADLVSDEARIAVSGAGRVLVQVEKTLRIALSGAGVVEYIGDPKVTQHVSGAGRVKRRDASDRESFRIAAGS